MEYYRARKRDIRMYFIDLEKAYDKVPRKVLFGGAITKKGISKTYIIIVQDIY